MTPPTTKSEIEKELREKGFVPFSEMMNKLERLEKETAEEVEKIINERIKDIDFTIDKIQVKPREDTEYFQQLINKRDECLELLLKIKEIKK